MSFNSNTLCNNMPCRNVDCSVFFDERNGRFYIKVGHLGCNTDANNGSGFATAEEARQVVASIKSESDRRYIMPHPSALCFVGL